MSYPFKAFPVSKSKPRKLAGKFALLGGMALLSAGTAFASDRTYGHAEVTIGNPNVHITVGKTWGSGNQNCDRHEEKDDYVIEKRVILTDDDCHHEEYGKVVVYRNHPRCHRDMRTVYIDNDDCHHNEYGKVVVYRNHRRCDREVRVFRHAGPVHVERDVHIIRHAEPVRIIHGNGGHRTVHRTVVVNGHDRHHDKKVIVTHRDRGHSGHKEWKGNGGNGGHKEYKDKGGDKIKTDKTDNGRHYGEKYEHSGHSSRRDENDRPSKRVTRERGRSGRML